MDAKFFNDVFGLRPISRVNNRRLTAKFKDEKSDTRNLKCSQIEVEKRLQLAKELFYSSQLVMRPATNKKVFAFHWRVGGGRTDVKAKAPQRIVTFLSLSPLSSMESCNVIAALATSMY